ncbi:MAG: GAF domain-containing protein [Anaerolineae bacterium]
MENVAQKLVRWLDARFDAYYKLWSGRTEREESVCNVIIHPTTWPVFMQMVRGQDGQSFWDMLAEEGSRLATAGTPLARAIQEIQEQFDIIAQDILSEPGMSPMEALAAWSQLRSWQDRAIVTLCNQYPKAEEQEAAQLAQERGVRPTDDLLAINKVASLINTSLSLKETLDTIVKVTTQLIGAQKASIALLQPGTDYLVINPQMGYVGSSREFAEAFRLRVDEGVGGWVMRHQKPYIVTDSEKEPRFTHQLAREEGVRSWIVAPLISKGNSIGLLYALNDYPCHFSDDQVKVLTLLANHAAIAIENARLFEETELRLREANALYEVSRNITGTLDLDEVLQLIVDEALKTIPNANKVVIHLLDPEQDELVPKALSNYQQTAVESSRMQPGMGIAGRAIEERRTIYVPDTRREPGFIDRGTPLQSLIVAPLVIGDKVIGTLSADSDKPNAFTTSNENLLTSLANQAAVAIENARLFDETTSEKRRTEAIIRHMADGVLLLDREGRVVSFNPALELLLGLKEAEVTGQSVMDESADHRLRVLAATTPQPVRAEEEPSQGAGEAFPMGQKVIEEEVTLGSPLNRVLKVYSSPVKDLAGEIIGQVKVVHDITRERELDQMKSDFLSTVSHELRTPLFSIQGFVKLLKDGKVPDTATQQEFLTIVNEQVEHLTRLVNDLLDLSRLDTGRPLKIEKQLVTMDGIVEGAVAKLRPMAQEKGISLAAGIAPTLPPVEADPQRLEQVITNLVENGIKFTPEQGEVEVTVKVKEMELLIQVRDTGIGIPPDALPRVFDRFYQVDHSTTRRAGGTGLGLHITKEIVEAHGGRIWAESTPGEGSTFSFTLPLAASG